MSYHIISYLVITGGFKPSFGTAVLKKSASVSLGVGFRVSVPVVIQVRAAS